MGISTPVLAAIIGSIVAGVISFVINITSLFGQYLINKRNRKWMNRFQWNRETISTVRELRRETLRMDLGGEDFDILDNLVGEIESQRHSIPPQYQESAIDSNLDRITLLHHNFDPQSDDSSLPEYRKSMINKTEDLLDSLGENVSNIDNLY